MMKLVLATTIALLAPYTAVAGPMTNCVAQNPCMKITSHKMDAEQCNGECQYKICMTLTLDAPGCLKAPGGIVQHTCQKPHLQCITTQGFMGASTPKTQLPQAYRHCQIVPVGGVAEFLLKDGEPNGGCGASSKEISKTTRATCSTYAKQSCSGVHNVGKECVWTVPAPKDCTAVAASFGDPHFKRWHTYEDVQNVHFHGECDLVMLQSDHVNGGDRMDLHVRTTIEMHYSFIESVALQVGESLVQIDRKTFYVNGQKHQDADLPIKLADFTILESEMIRNSKVYTIELNDKSRVTIKKVKHFLAVAVYGHEEDFAHSTGILGDYYTGTSLGRDGVEIFDTTDLGMEWQVREDDPNLFMDLREPQLPKAQCNMPTMKKISRHARALATTEQYEQAKLRCEANKEDTDACLEDAALQNSELYQQATIACADKADVESCLEDVMATGDIDIADHQDW